MTSRRLLASQNRMFSFMLVMGIFLSGTESKGCTPPAQSFNFSLLPLDTDVDQVQEVMFLGVVGPFEEKRVCKIKCVDGRWIGPLCSLEQDSTKFQSMSRPCTIHNVPKNSVISYKGRKITPSPELEFAHGSTVACRCLEPGRYKLLGDTKLICRNSKWSGTFPVCLTTNVFSNFSDDLPPALEWTVAGGGGAVDDQGVIVLLPGSILHLDCLYPRLHGNPTWKWTNTFRQYPTGWAISRAERELRYRLSLYYAKPRDSGTYTCTSPRGYTNSFEVAVQDVACPSFEVSEGIVMMEGRGSSLGDVVSFSCPTGYYLVGSNTSTCLPSGSWSSQIPKCEVVRCPLISSPDLRLIVDALNTSYTGLAVFSCLLGFRLRGPKYIECTSNGTWSKPPPVCDEIHCPEPEAPWQGSIQVDRASPRAFVVGDSITYTCKSSFVLKGRSLAFCTPEGKWSHPQPKCMESCAHPGSPVHGRVSPRRQRYEIGAVALVTCRPGYRPAGPDRLTCLPSVRLWSSPVPVCVPALGR